MRDCNYRITAKTRICDALLWLVFIVLFLTDCYLFVNAL